MPREDVTSWEQQTNYATHKLLASQSARHILFHDTAICSFNVYT